MERTKTFVREAWLEVRNACGIVFLAMVFFGLFYFVGALCLAFFISD
jgi:hypothetical protein